MRWSFLAVLLLAGSLAAAQEPVPSALPAAPADPAVEVRGSYILGAEDEISIRVLDAEGIDDKPLRIDFSGYIRLPMIGRIHAAGLTVDQLEAKLVEQFKTYIVDPQVVVVVTEFRSQPVSVIGAVKNPGVQQVQGRKTLLEMLSLAGGIAPEAGHSIKITRRKAYGPIPLTTVQPDASGEFTVADVDLTSILEASNPQENIEVKPYDVITVPPGQLVYVMGQVRRPGGFVLRQRETLSALQALSLAEGLDRAASPQNARILRTIEGAQQRTEIYIDMRKVLQGKSSDVPLMPNDVLFIPNNVPKSAMLRGMEAALQIGTGVAIYRR
jgi:polysaccharide biosynthesis/export protein